MAQYINKDVLLAEIERKIRTEQGYSSGDAECGYRDCAKDILSFLDTIEVKDANEALRTEYEKGRADVIEKACEFLKSYRQDTFDGTGYISGIINDETIEDFKKVVGK